MPRLPLALLFAALAFVCIAPSGARADDYWSYADRIQTHLDARTKKLLRSERCQT